MPEKLSQGPRANPDLSRSSSGLGRGPTRSNKLPASPLSGTWPAPGSTLDLDFANDSGWVRGVGQGRSMDAVTFTRASSGTFVGPDGLLNTATNNIPRFDWGSTTQLAQKNLLTFTEDLENAAWAKNSITVSSNVTLAPDGGSLADLIVPSATSAVHSCVSPLMIRQFRPAVISVYVKAAGARYFGFRVGAGPGRWAFFDFQNIQTFTLANNSTTNFSNVTVTDAGNGWFRIVLFTDSDDYGGNSLLTVYTLGSQPAGGGGFLESTLAYLGDGVSGVYVWGAQSESGNVVTNYVAVGSVAPTNTPLVANPTCNGLLVEEARTNRALWCRDATNSSWTKTNTTAALNQIGIDGVSSSATSLTATAANATCVQTVTLTSGSRTSSIYLKRVTGTGIVQCTLDGSTWSTVDLSTTEWRRIVLSGTVTNPAVGVRLLTNGDAVAMDYAQIEDGLIATSPILTTAATVTRAEDVAELRVANFTSWYNPKESTFSIESFSSYIYQSAIAYPTYVNSVFGMGIAFNSPDGTSVWGVRAGTRSNFTIDSNLTFHAGGGTDEGAIISNIVPVRMVTKMASSVLLGTSFSTAYFGLVAKEYDSSTQIGARSVLTASTLKIGTSFLHTFSGTVKRVVYYPNCYSDDVIRNLSL